jgi:hypothetical protein
MIVRFMVGLSWIVAGAGAGLVSASPERPAQPMAELSGGAGVRRREQVLDSLQVSAVSRKVAGAARTDGGSR